MLIDAQLGGQLSSLSRLASTRPLCFIVLAAPASSGFNCTSIVGSVTLAAILPQLYPLPPIAHHQFITLSDRISCTLNIDRSKGLKFQELSLPSGSTIIHESIPSYPFKRSNQRFRIQTSTLQTAKLPSRIYLSKVTIIVLLPLARSPA